MRKENYMKINTSYLRTGLIVAAACAALVAVACTIPTSSHAGDLTFNVGATTDYVARGSTQTDHLPSYSIGAEYDLKGFYANVETENMNFRDGATQEVDLGAGYRTTYRGVDFEAGFAAYNYKGDPGNGEDMEEGHLTVAKHFGRVTETVNVAYSPNYFNMGTRSVWYEAKTSYVVTKKLSVSGALGYQTIDRKNIFPPYATYNVGFTYELMKGLTVDVRHTENNLKASRVGFFADPSNSVGITKTF